MFKSKLTGYIYNKLRNSNSEIYRGYPLIRTSKVENLNLISRQAILRDSELQGNVSVGDDSKITNALIIGNVTIGRHSTFNGPNSDIWALVNFVRIGNFCSIARNVSIQEYDHIFDRITSYFMHANLLGGTMQEDIVSKGDIFIGNDVWIGTQSVILSGASISDGAVIGANSVVNSYIPPYAVAVGSPAKVVKYRFSEQLIEQLLKIKWWDWDDDKIRCNRFLFDSPLTEEKLVQII